MLTRARSIGYQVVEQDDKRFYFRVQAHLDADVAVGNGGAVARISYFGVQVYAGGLVEITAVGYHMRRNTMRVALRDEFSAFSQSLRAGLV